MQVKIKSFYHLEVKDKISGKIKKIIEGKNHPTTFAKITTFPSNYKVFPILASAYELGLVNDTTTYIPDTTTIENILYPVYKMDTNITISTGRESSDPNGTEDWVKYHISYIPSENQILYGFGTLTANDNKTIQTLVFFDEPLPITTNDALSGIYQIEYLTDFNSKIALTKNPFSYHNDSHLPSRTADERLNIYHLFKEVSSDINTNAYWDYINNDVAYRLNQLNRVFKHQQGSDDWQEDYVTGQTINSSGSIILEYSDNTTNLFDTSTMLNFGKWSFYTKFTETGGINSAKYRPYFKVEGFYGRETFLFDNDIRRITYDLKLINKYNNDYIDLKKIFLNVIDIKPYDVNKILLMFPDRIDLFDWSTKEQTTILNAPLGHTFQAPDGYYRYSLFYDVQSHYLAVWSDNGFLLYYEDEPLNFTFIKDISFVGRWIYCINYPYCVSHKNYNICLYNIESETKLVDIVVWFGMDYYTYFSTLFYENYMFVIQNDDYLYVADTVNQTIEGIGCGKGEVIKLAKSCPYFCIPNHSNKACFYGKIKNDQWVLYPRSLWASYETNGNAKPFGALEDKVVSNSVEEINGVLKWTFVAGNVEPSFVEGEHFSITSSNNGLYSDKLQKHYGLYLEGLSNKENANILFKKDFSISQGYYINNFYNNVLDATSKIDSGNYDGLYLYTNSKIDDALNAGKYVYLYAVNGGYNNNVSFFGQITKSVDNYYLYKYYLSSTKNYAYHYSFGVNNLKSKYILLPYKWSGNNYWNKFYIWSSNRDLKNEVEFMITNGVPQGPFYDWWKNNINTNYLMVYESGWYAVFPFFIGQSDDNYTKKFYLIELF